MSWTLRRRRRVALTALGWLGGTFVTPLWARGWRQFVWPVVGALIGWLVAP